jgi:hypothetical protein
MDSVCAAVLFFVTLVGALGTAFWRYVVVVPLGSNLLMERPCELCLVLVAVYSPRATVCSHCS